MANPTPTPDGLYGFLRERAETGEPFSLSGFMQSTGASEGVAHDYLAGPLKDFLLDDGQGTYRVKKQLLRHSERALAERFRGQHGPPAQYRRVAYRHIVTYEFLLHLTREDKLRAALEDLFYRDTLEQRLMEIGPSALHDIIARNSGETDEAYLERVLETVSGLFGGYSITHVNGRFRAEDLATRQEALYRLYLVDETTAVVRFVIPLACGRHEHGAAFEWADQPVVPAETVRDEEDFIRRLFFLIFVEAVVATVQGEDKVWLVEIGKERHLYVWEKKE